MLNKFFSNVVTNLNIPQFHQIDQTSENISDPVIKAIVKYRAIGMLLKSSFVENADILKEIKMLR